MNYIASIVLADSFLPKYRFQRMGRNTRKITDVNDLQLSAPTEKQDTRSLLPRTSAPLFRTPCMTGLSHCASRYAGKLCKTTCMYSRNVSLAPRCHTDSRSRDGDAVRLTTLGKYFKHLAALIYAPHLLS